MCTAKIGQGVQGVRRLATAQRHIDLEQVCDLILTGGTRLKYGGQRLGADETVTQMGLLTLPPPDDDDDGEDREDDVSVFSVFVKELNNSVRWNRHSPSTPGLPSLNSPGMAVGLRVASRTQPAREISHLSVCQCASVPAAY